MYRKAYEKIKLNKLIVIKALEMPSKEKNVKISTCGININI